MNGEKWKNTVLAAAEAADQRRESAKEAMAQQHRERTLTIDEVISRLQELKLQHGNVPCWFMEPMMGVRLPLNADKFEVSDGQVDIWPE